MSAPAWSAVEEGPEFGPASDAHIRAAQSELADLFARVDRAVLSFSGGKESIVLADLCAPWRDRVSLMWTNTGAMAPHMAEFVRSYGDAFPLQEIAAPDLLSSWREHGIPADAMTTESIRTDATGTRLQPWLSCCIRIRNMPALHAVAEMALRLGGTTGLIIGQRREDRALTPEGLVPMLPESVVGSFPIFDWSTEQVFDYIATRDLPLPPQYAEGLDSLECIVCPAAMTPKRLSYLRREHPTAAQIALVGMRAALETVSVEAGRLSGLVYGSSNDAGSPAFAKALEEMPQSPKLDAAVAAGADRNRILAYHEAGHAVVAERHGLHVREARIELDRYGAVLFDGSDATTLPDLLAFFVAGNIASEIGCPEVAEHLSIDEDELAAALAAAGRDAPLYLDEAMAIRGGVPSIPDAEALAVYRDAEREIRAELSQPKVWAQVEAVASALYDRGRLTGAELRDAIGKTDSALFREQPDNSANLRS